MVTYAQVRATRPAAWLQICGGLRALAARLAEHAEDATAHTRRLRAVWRGAAGTAAGAELERLGDAVAGLAPPILGADQVLVEYATGVATVQHALSDLVAEMARHGVRVSEQGGLDGADQTVARDGAERIAALLELVGAAEAEAARRLEALVPALCPAGSTSQPGWIPSTGGDPAVVHRWWLGLTEAQRRWLFAHEPDRLGELDGVPAAVRDQVNRLRLDALAGPAALPGLGALPELGALRARLATDDPARAYLLALDPARGRAVVATGDPDRADNVLTYVPGTGESLGALGRLLDRADRIAARATVPGQRTAVVVWLGYDTPGDVIAAATTGAAQRAEAGLARFTAGLRATHEAGSVHQTVLGHSYGSLVVGLTAHDLGLAADDVVFIASPGVGVDRAAELRLPSGHVWSSTAVNDPIGLLRAGSGIGDPFVMGRTGAADGQWFGTDPSSAGFGGRVFHADPGDPHHPLEAHSAYFDDGNAALDAIVAIARGDAVQVRS